MMNKILNNILNNIPQGRALIYLVILCFIPSFIAALYIFSRLSDLDDLETKRQRVEEQAFTKEKRQSLNQTLRTHFKDADHFYIDKYLETLVFLEPEIETLQKITQSKNFPDDEGIKKRLEFLTGPANHLSFTEGVVQSYGTFQETTETLSHPLEVNIKDLYKILSRIEGIKVGDENPPPSRPQLIILDFRLDKKKGSDNQSEAFLLNMKLLKREFL